MQDQGQRTEKPTKRKLEKARREGQFPASRELLAALQFVTFVVLLSSAGSDLLSRTRRMASYFLTGAFHLELTPRGIDKIYRQSVGQVFQPLLWMGACLAAAALAGQLGSTGFGISLHKLAPDPKRLNPLQKLRSIPQQNAASCLQAMVFLPLLGLAVWKIASKNF